MPVQAAFNLNPNEIFASIANMIISQQVFADNLGKHQTLVDKARVDGGLYGDKKLYYATDVLKSHPWGNDAEASNLLSLDRPADPEVQDITLDVFRQIRLTVDNYLSKRAWSNEGAFSEFNSVMLGWMRETKRVYDGTLYNVFIGSTETSVGKQIQSIDITTAVGSATGEEANRLEAEAIAQHIADLLVEMGDYSRDFNDYGFLRSYAEDAIKVVWNAKFVNKIRKVDLPTIFHKEGLVDKFEEDVLPERYFGRAIAESDIGSGKVIGTDGAYDSTKGTLRAAKEFDYNNVHYFPGDALATSGTYVAVVGGLEVSQVYLEEDDVICKVLVKLPPMMSAFEVGTSFFNPRSLTENHYLTFGHNTLEYLKNYPFITIKAI
ncbi:MAG: hypothetical protein IKN46_01600 [Acholeplasmatales bacterium]|nr:hypothetical protein [Acholeplasmatales bacterium]